MTINRLYIKIKKIYRIVAFLIFKTRGKNEKGIYYWTLSFYYEWLCDFKANTGK
ncbi:hypothetical protein HCCG_00465 [Helicobacter cinaedi CCUG 18818 = ATCC BAA-847]|uniref:Uncharacterized protein n=1 Tax=Helicobacter cinaedi CCUG 18818 = ATCC BAA-847 TaxID=537971 RepID=A0ABN0BB10_9HELI|nr:hypothetical protein HCCG_00465 [Helicobacter cinaedi CCUG 18818 = ATCC BAA-847]